jgi:hypothetical protein
MDQFCAVKDQSMFLLFLNLRCLYLYYKSDPTVNLYVTITTLTSSLEQTSILLSFDPSATRFTQNISKIFVN